MFTCMFVVNGGLLTFLASVYDIWYISVMRGLNNSYLCKPLLVDSGGTWSGALEVSVNISELTSV